MRRRLRLEAFCGVRLWAAPASPIQDRSGENGRPESNHFLVLISTIDFLKASLLLTWFALCLFEYRPDFRIRHAGLPEAVKSGHSGSSLSDPFDHC
jgi:hypothetical protein